MGHIKAFEDPINPWLPIYFKSFEALGGKTKTK